MTTVFRNIPFAHLNMTNVIISYYIEVVNVMVTFAALPLIYVMSIHPLPLVIAQFCTVGTFCCGSLIVALGSTVSCFQILYVTQFEILFTLDPATVGWRTFLLLAGLVICPMTMVAVFMTLKGIHVDKSVANLTQTVYNGEGVQFLAIYSICWTVLFLVLSSMAFVFIPLFFKKKQNQHNSQLPPPRIISLQRYLLGALGLVVLLLTSVYGTKENEGRPFTLLNLFLLFIFNLLLAYHLTEKETRTVVRRYIFNLFGIEENNNNNMTRRLGRISRENTSEHILVPPHSTIRDTVMTSSSTTNVLSNSTFINVLPVRNNFEDA